VTAYVPGQRVRVARTQVNTYEGVVDFIDAGGTVWLQGTQASYTPGATEGPGWRTETTIEILDSGLVQGDVWFDVAQDTSYVYLGEGRFLDVEQGVSGSFPDWPHPEVVLRYRNGQVVAPPAPPAPADEQLELDEAVPS
jgi:hypothetical protein